MAHKPNIRWIWNTEDAGHGTALLKQLERATRLDVVVAFARQSGLDEILGTLKARLDAGLQARFVVGLNFYQTEPPLLDALLELSEENEGALTLYLARSEDTFHPKLYAFEYRRGGGAVIVGSANLTGGGLWNNYEASVQIDDPDGEHIAQVATFIDELIEWKEIVPATRHRIDAYREAHDKHQKAQARTRGPAGNALDAATVRQNVAMSSLRDALEAMRADASEQGFATQMKRRRAHRRQAAERIRELAAADPLTPAAFLDRFKPLLECFHSGGLFRAQSTIAEYAPAFQEALARLLAAEPTDPAEAFQLLLEPFQDIPRAGTNLLSEILHALDAKRFAVMNQNSVAGLQLANISAYPAKPTKKTVGAETYAAFCRDADLVRDALGLKDLSELDAVFNHAYWV